MSYHYDNGSIVISDKRITSKQDPYQIVDIAHFISDERNPSKPGKLLISMSPGKQDNKWNRDLNYDLEIIMDNKIDVIVCLLEWSEMRMLNIIDYPHKAQEAGIIFYHLPIRDRNVPRQKEIITLIPLLVQHLSAGKNVLIHCRAGRGRAGLICACCLTHFGYSGKSAIDFVRIQRPNAVQTLKQEECVIIYENYLTAGI